MSTDARNSRLKGKFKGSDRREYIQVKHLKVRSWKNIKIWAAKEVSNQPSGKQRGKIVRQIAEMLGVSRTSIYGWLKIFQQFGKDGFRKKSRRPKTIHRITLEQEKEILELRKNTGLGCEKLAFDLPVSATTVWRYLSRNKCLPRKRFKRRKWKYFQRNHVNSLWQIDLSQLSENIWSISILDDHSRFIAGFHVDYGVPTVDGIVALLERTIPMYGKPRQILTDHGSQFTANQEGAVSTFDLWCNSVGIHHINAGIRKPTTIGKIEKWHDTLKNECLWILDDIALNQLDVVREKCNEFIQYYNYSRPHFGYEIYEFYGISKKRRVLFIPYLRMATHR